MATTAATNPSQQDAQQRQRPPPPLPTELWIRILGNLNKDSDLPQLWTSCRHVSTVFRDVVEFMFRGKHLSKTWIHYDLGIHYSEDYARMLINVKFRFARLSDDRERAIFHLDQCAEAYKDLLRRRLRKRVEKHDLEAPHHSVQVRRDLNDTPIPALQVDYENLELSCNWKSLLSSFYGEARLYHELQGAWVESQKDWVSGLHTQRLRGQRDMASTMMQAIASFGKQCDEARIKARRLRIRKQFMELDGFEWDAERDWDLVEERAVMRRLAQKAQVASQEEYSDDEEMEFELNEEEDWDDGDGDEDEDSEGGFDVDDDDDYIGHVA
ncbi:hypothetical protein BP5796_08303 [Coleophoma crateriformis]|uniref:F-box domain-containing protein n=1 Tax=Coleophoma crateriformis TaxID=565419 RepID=A0A3D8R7E8_9HELO|nr:hypothetical protein BP5796_08303 [Coleophoma crateriformis]